MTMDETAVFFLSENESKSSMFSKPYYIGKKLEMPRQSLC